MSRKLSEKQMDKLALVLEELEKMSPCDKHSFVEWEYIGFDDGEITLQETIHEETNDEHKNILHESTKVLWLDDLESTDNIGEIARKVD